MSPPTREFDVRSPHGHRIVVAVSAKAAIKAHAHNGGFRGTWRFDDKALTAAGEFWRMGATIETKAFGPVRYSAEWPAS